MSDPTDPWKHALGIGNALLERFFPSFESTREEAVSFSGDGSALYFQGQELHGPEAIAEFLLSLSPFSGLVVTGLEVQPIPTADDSWSMIIATGKVGVGNERATFHSTFCVQSRKEDCQAFIRSHSFTWT
jgi:hypothetical protein